MATVLTSGGRRYEGRHRGFPLDAPPRELIDTRGTLEPAVAGVAASRITSEVLRVVPRDLDKAAGLVNEPSQPPRSDSLACVSTPTWRTDAATDCWPTLSPSS